MLNHDNICMSVFHSLVIREKPSSKRPRKQSMDLYSGRFVHRVLGKGRNWVNVSGRMPYRVKNVDTLTSSQTLIPPFQIQTMIPKPRPILLV